MIKIKANICTACPKLTSACSNLARTRTPRIYVFVCLFCSVFMYCRRKVSAVKIGDGVVFISSKSQKRESQMMASIKDRLCISYDQKKFHSTTFSNMPGSTERQASQDDLTEQDGQAGDMQGGLLLLPDLDRLLALVVVLLHGGLVHQAARSRLPLCSLSQHLVVPVRTKRIR